MKWLNRLRRRFAAAAAPKPIWSRHTHAAYPEIQVRDDGSWIVRFYAYEGAGAVLSKIEGKAPDAIAARKAAGRAMWRGLRAHRRAAP